MIEVSRLIHRLKSQVAQIKAETHEETTLFMYLITQKGVVFLLLKFTVKDFLDDRKINNCSPKTITSYYNSLKQFQEFRMTRDIVNVENISSATVKTYHTTVRNWLSGSYSNPNIRKVRKRILYFSPRMVAN